MNAKMKVFFFGLMCSVLLFSRCSNDSDPEPEPTPDPPDPDPPAAVTITGTSPEYTFWGDELTINGTGFSTTKSENIVTFVSPEGNAGTDINPTSAAGGDIEIVQATATQLKIRVPFKKVTGPGGSDAYRGYDVAKIEVKVNSKVATTTDYVKFVGHPYISSFNYHYGWYDYGNVTRIGDSVMINAGFSGGFVGDYAEASGYFNKLRLSIDDQEWPIKYREIGTNSGWVVFLPIDDFGRTSETICDEIAPSGDRGRKMKFEVWVEGTDKKASREDMYVLYLPGYSVSGGTGPGVISKTEVSQGNPNPFWTVTGKNMFHQWALFTSNCGGPPVEIELANPDTFHDEYTVHIPLGAMEENCSYTLRLKGVCDHYKEIGTILIKP